MKILHLSPHPDDEIIGAGATLLTLRDAGHKITNLAYSIGAERRRDELVDACLRAEYELIITDIDAPSSKSQRDPEIKYYDFAKKIVDDYDLIIAPSPHDAHPAHEAVGRVAIKLSRDFNKPVWFWGIWADLALPTVMVPFDQKRMDEILYVVQAHVGEIERNDYAKMIVNRAKANSILGVERVFGYGSQGLEEIEYVELLTEAVNMGDYFALGAPKILDPSNPFDQPEHLNEKNSLKGRAINYYPDITGWLDSESVNDRLSSGKFK